MLSLFMDRVLSVVNLVGINLNDLISTQDFPERWNCGNWTEFHGWVHIISDLAIWFAYTSIPIALLYFINKQKRSIPYPWLWVMFSLFILACGLSHLIEAFIFWWPAYRLLGLVKLLTAIISVLTALSLLPIIPKLLALKTKEELDEATKEIEYKRRRDLEERELILDTIMEDSFSGYWDWKISEDTVFFSPTFKSMFGYKDHEIKNEIDAWEKIIHKDDLELVKKNFEKHFSSEGVIPFNQRVRYYHKNGNMMHVICRGNVIEWDNKTKKPIRMIGCHINVTDLANAESKLVDRNKLLELVTESINVGIWNWNLLNNKSLWSSRFYQLLGYEENEIKSGSENFINKLLHPEDKTIFEKGLAEHLDKKTPLKIEIRLKHKDGSYRWFETVGKAKFNERGTLSRVVTSINDIHTKKELEIENKSTITDLDRQNKRLINFAHIVSHNLRSYTGNIVSLLGLYKEEKEDLLRDEILEHVSRNSNYLNETVEHLAEVVSIQTDIDKTYQILNFNDVANKAIATFRDKIDDLGASISTDFKVSEINYIASYLDSIFLNLLSNSIKYRSPKRPLQIEIKSYVEDNDLILSYSDNGLGIDLIKNKEKIFGLYKTFHNNADSRGVGLFLVRNQIESTNGSIHIESEVDVGTSFKISFRKIT